MILSWGKPTIVVAAVADTGAVTVGEFPTPVEDSSELSTEKGDKVEANIEGGAAEAVRYKDSKYTFKCSVRQGAGRTMPIAGTNGVVPGEYSVTLTPEDKRAPGFIMARAVCSYEDTYTAADGLIRVYTFDSLDNNGKDQVSITAGTTTSGS